MIAKLVDLYMRAKRSWSRCLAKRKPKAPLPEFKTPQEIARFIEASVTYTTDHMGGACDVYSHPGEVMHWVAWNLEKRNYGAARFWPLRLDCDDVSTFAYAAAQKLPVLKSAKMIVFRYPTIKAALAHAWKNLRSGDPFLFYFHEGCLVEERNGDKYLIDANGIFEVTSAAHAAEVLSRLFNVELVPQETTYPFEV